MSKITYVKNTPGIVLSSSNVQSFLDSFVKDVAALGLTPAQATAVNDVLSDQLIKYVTQNAVTIPASLNDNVHALNDSYAGIIPPTLVVTIMPATK